MKATELRYSKFRKIALILRTLNHEMRQKIIKMLEENDSMVVTDIYVKLRVDQAVASQHLATLRKSGVVTTKRKGKYIHYQVNRVRLREINHLIDQIAN